MCLETVHELRLCGSTVDVMTPDAAASGSSGVSGEALAAASSDVVRSLAGRQFDLAEGPSREAFTSGRIIVAPDLTANEGRWPVWTPVAVAAGVSGAYALPLGIGADRLGAFTCYASDGLQLDHRAVQRLVRSADEVTELLLSLRGDGRGLFSDAHDQQDLHIRAEVYQAQGMLMVALGVPLSEALALLRAMAYAEELDLNQLAIDLVAGRRPLPERDLED